MIVEPPPSKPRQPPRAWQRWWFWTAVGVVVLGGIGVGVARRPDRGRRCRRPTSATRGSFEARARDCARAARRRVRLPPRPERGVADRRHRVGHAADGRRRWTSRSPDPAADRALHEPLRARGPATDRVSDHAQRRAAGLRDRGRSTSRCAPTMPAARRSPPVTAAITIDPGERQTVYVRLDCGGDRASSTAGLETPTAACRRPTRAAATGASIRARPATPRSRRAIPAGARCRATTTSRARRDTRDGQRLHRECSHEPIQDVVPFDDCCPAAPVPTGRSRQRLLADVRQRGRRSGRDLRHDDPAGHARRLPAHGRLPGRDVRHSVHRVGRHLLGCLQCVADRHAVGQGLDSCCPPGATHAGHRLPDSVRQRGRGSDEICDSGIAPARRAPARRAATTETHAPPITSGPKAARPCATIPDHGADLRRRMLSAGGDEPRPTTTARRKCRNGVVERGERCDCGLLPDDVSGATPGHRDVAGACCNVVVGDPRSVHRALRDH